MSVNVNTVYTRVLAITNKEQRGYITPTEFNIFANQAQMDIFEQYFYDLNQFMRLPGNDTGHADMVSLLQEKISIFNKSKSGASDLSISSNKITIDSSDLYRTTAVFLSDKQCDRVTKKEAKEMLNSPLHVPTADRPIYYEEQGGYFIYNSSSLLSTDANVAIDYIKTPTDVNWGYSTVSGAAIHNSSASTNFELHESEETELVIKILELSGIAIRQGELATYAGGIDNKSIQQEKM